MIDNYIQKYRENVSMSRVDLAERSGLCYGQIYALETGRRSLLHSEVDTMMRIGKALGLYDPTMLIKEEGDPDGL